MTGTHLAVVLASVVMPDDPPTRPNLDILPDPPARAPDDPLVQMNVRIPTSLRDAIDRRRASIGPTGLSRDKWVTRALTLALRVSTPIRTAGGRTAPPPTRRNL